MAPSALPADSWSRYRGNLARHLIGVSRDLQAGVMRALRDEAGFTGLRPSIGPLLSLVWKEGRSPTFLAAELGISSQACGQLVEFAERAGYLERVPNPEDRRSKLVLLTPRGQELVAEGVRLILETERDYAERVGAPAYRGFTASLAALYRGLGIPTHADAALTERAGRSIGVLPLVAVRIQQELMQATIARGHGGLKMSHGQVLPHVGPEGARVAEIARLQGVSRQAIFATSRDLEAQGYLRRDPDPLDRRGVVLRLSRRGERLIGDSLGALDDLRDRFRALLSARRFARLETVARELFAALQLEEQGVAERERAEAKGSPRAAGATADISRLAARLRRELGRRDAARLGALLASAAGGSTP